MFMLTATGKVPVEEQFVVRSSKTNIKLDPSQRADEAVKTVALHLLDAMEANLPGVLADADPEFLHAYRIGVRRTRSILSQLKALFPPAIQNHFTGEFKWIGDVTSPVRDLDVYLLSFENDRSWLPEPIQDDLNPLRDFLIEEQRAAHSVLVAYLTSPRYGLFVEAWRKYISSPPLDPPPNSIAGQPVIDVVSKRIWKTYRRVIKQGRAILRDPDTPAEALHELRKTCKKLRYLLEMFVSLYPRKSMKRMIGALKVLQDNLGSFQDYEVQQQKLHVFAGRMLGQRFAKAETYLAMGRLETHLEALQWKARKDFAGLFNKFDKPVNRKRFERLFRDARV